MSPTEAVHSDRLSLTPLEVAHATEMVGVLSDPALYTFTGGDPPTLGVLENRYRHQVAGCPRDDEIWHNWILHIDGVAIGFVQTTVKNDTADLAWVVGSRWQGAGYATEASAAMCSWLAEQGIGRFSAHIHPDHTASQAVATRIGLHPTGQIDEDGEMIWAGGG